MDQNEDLIKIQAEPVDHMIDTIGAGTYFIAGLIDQLTEQKSFSSAYRFARRLAAKRIQNRAMTINEA